MFEVTIDKVTLSLNFSFYLNSNFPFKEDFMIRAMKFRNGFLTFHLHVY